MPTKLLITGSREASPKMLKHARKAVERAKELGWEVIVGDAEGVDTAVIDACDELGVPVDVYGAYSTVRHRSKTGRSHFLKCSYPERDRIMASKCDVCYAIWNGTSRGTMITYHAAKKGGKQVYLYEDQLSTPKGK